MQRIVAWPVVRRDQIVSAFKPGGDPSAEGPFRTLRRHGWASAGMRVSRHADRGIAGQLTVFSNLNVDSARLARRGERVAAERVARAAAELESGPEFAQLRGILAGLSRQEAERVVDGALPQGESAGLAEALRAVALRTDSVLGDELGIRSPAEIAFAGQIARVHQGYAVLVQAGGPDAVVPRWMLDVVHEGAAGAHLVLVADQLGHGSTVLNAVPGINIEPGGRAGHTTKGASHTMDVMDGTLARVSRNGQISVPAAVRHRWGTASVLVVDRGGYAIVRPVPQDPIAALRGAYATAGPTSEEARAADRAAEAAGEDRRQGGAA